MTKNCAIIYQPHDLLWFSTPAALGPATSTPVPEWARGGGITTWPVVVRRDLRDPYGRLPVGLRGPQRHHRLAAWLRPEAITRHVRPEDLATQHPWINSLPPHPQARPTADTRQHTRLDTLPALRALNYLAPRLDNFGFPWGPTGSVGYTLATSHIACNADSDLDLIIRLSAPLSADDTRHLALWLDQAPGRVDIQVDTGDGAFAFNEWCRNPRNMLLKTSHGPVNIALYRGETPWRRHKVPEDTMSGPSCVCTDHTHT